MSHPHYQERAAVLSNHARPVIINVDDLGLSTAVNDAVIHLAELGRIGASSYMVGGTITDSEINRLNQLNVDIGLHLDLTGIFPSALRGSLKSIIIASYLRRFNPMQVTDIIKQQLDGFEERFNRAPVFIDGHQHIHQFPVIRQCLINELTNRYRSEISKGTLSARVTTPLINDVKSWIIYILGGYAWRESCQHHQILTNDKFGGVYGFDADRQQLAMLWEKWLQGAPCHTANVSPTLIMCHPAVPDNASHSWQDDIKAAREIEYEWLISDAFKNLLHKHNVRLMRWSDMTSAS
ncbi:MULTISPECIES: ChbG/HpnK family deacetylase [unclassified Psychrobacter]|uniref:ChbG/HpnK family deacetylase n=1 Tax=unclassified Psychrobacter TaxID=196806 RepID=UPI0025F17C72|nr:MULTISPECIES: ChbG/HpnK family deacetylase [unclassified Psychrobacter]